MQTLRLVAWGHRRATDPLHAAVAAFRARDAQIAIEIDVRPLSDFEHQGMVGVAAEYDLIVFDHPFCGDIAAGGLFLPLEGVLADRLGPAAASGYIGPSLQSYLYQGHVWGAPIDAATQHGVYRRDLLEPLGEPVPVDWASALALSVRLRAHGLFLGTAVETPHALMSVASLMANAGRPWSGAPGQGIGIDEAAFARAYDQLRALLACCPPDALAWNSIDLHEAMVARDDVAYCPAVYGYATYGEADQRRRLSFSSFAGAAIPYAAGSTIGGTALGVSARCRAPEAALAFVRFMLEEPVQRDLVTAHHGQPAILAGWHDAPADQTFNSFFSATGCSLRLAWVRPREPGYPQFQAQAGAVVADALRAGERANGVASAVARLAARVGSG